MKRLRPYCEDLDDVADKGWERREVDPDRSSLRRHFYAKSESLRRSSSLMYDRSIDDERDGVRLPRKRYDHEMDGFDRRKSFDRYRDGSDRAMQVSSPRGSYGSERLHRSDSFSAIRRDFPKGFRSERDRSRRDGCGGFSWKRLSCGKDAVDEGKRSSGGDSEERGKFRLRDLSCRQNAKDAESVKVEIEKVLKESCSSSEMEEGELKPDLLPSYDTRGQAEKDAQHFEDKGDVINGVSEASPENNSVQLSVKKSDSVEETSSGERSIEMEVDRITKHLSLQEEHVKVIKKLDEEESDKAEGFIERTGQTRSLSERQGKTENSAEETCEEEKLEGTSCVEKYERFGCENPCVTLQVSNLDMKNPLEQSKAKDNELVSSYTSLEENLEETVNVKEIDLGVEIKEEICGIVGAMQKNDKGIGLHSFEKEQRQRKDINLQAATNCEAECSTSVKDIKYEINLTLEHVAKNSRDKGKSVAHTLSNMVDYTEDEDAFEGPSRRGFELVFTDRISQPDKAQSCALGGEKIKNAELKLEPLELTLGLPSALPDQSPKPLSSQPCSPGRTLSIQSFASSFQTISDGFTNTISFSNSQPFVCNPNCSFTQNSMDNFEQSVGSRSIFQGVDQASIGTVWQSQTSLEPKRKGRSGALFHTVLLNGIQSQNSLQGINGPHNLNSKALLLQPSFQKQQSPPQSVGSHDTQSECRKEKRVLARERSFNSFSRSEQLETEQVVVNTPSVVMRIMSRIVSEPFQVMERMLQDMSEHSIEYLKDSICKMLADADKRGQIHALQAVLQRRSDLTAETLERSLQILLKILVALKTGLPDFLQRLNNTPSSDLVEIYHNLKCRNNACGNMLPVDDCDCKICSQKNGFCSACMCLICSKFDMASNTCSWVGCDVCLHWCHTDCGLRGSHIRIGQSSVAPRATEMQFHCLACGHPSEMFGFVKEVFKMCSRNWKVENLAMELQYVMRIFSASNDLRGKSLYQVAGQMLVKLEDKKKHFDVIESIMSFLSESEPSIISSDTPPPPLPYSLFGGEKPSGNNCQAANAVPSSRASCAGFEEERRTPDELEGVVGFKRAEAEMYQERSDSARREAEGLKRIAAAKNGRIDEEYSGAVARVGLQEAEKKRRLRLEELQAAELAHGDFVSLKLKMEAQIQDLLLKMEAASHNFSL